MTEQNPANDLLEKKHTRSNEDDSEIDVHEEWNTDPHTGLTEGEAAARLKKHGPNVLKSKALTPVKTILKVLAQSGLLILETAAITAVALRDWINIGVICSLICYIVGHTIAEQNEHISFWQDLRRSMQGAVRNLVLRNGDMVEIPSLNIVPGDVVYIEKEGAIIPADGRTVMDDGNLEVDQSAITGESEPVAKHEGDMCFSSTVVVQGEAFLIVQNTGCDTFVGRTMSLIDNASSDLRAFGALLQNVGVGIILINALILLLIWVLSLYRSNSVSKILRFTLNLVVLGVPTVLKGRVRNIKAIGAGDLTKKKVILQNLSAIESLAGADILCVDKTGTLTRNRLSLAEPYCHEGIEPDDLMLIASLTRPGNDKRLDPIDKAVRRAIRHYSRARADLLKYKMLDYQPFSISTKMMQSLVESPSGERIICVKGAPRAVLELCSRDGGLRPDSADRYKGTIAESAKNGFRSLGVARKRGNRKFELLGFMLMSDPPQHHVARLIKEARSLGLTIKMVTGDAKIIAERTAQQMGLGQNILETSQLEEQNSHSVDSLVSELVETADGFAEVFPEHKDEIVRILQERGHVVAITGDGVADSRCLKRANVGIAVEGSSEAAQAASDLVLLMPGFRTVLSAFKGARQIFHCAYAYIVYQLALALHLVIFLSWWMISQNESLDFRSLILILVATEITGLGMPKNDPLFSKSPAKMRPMKIWGSAILLGTSLAFGTGITSMLVMSNCERDGSLCWKRPFPIRDQTMVLGEQLLFLQIVLTQHWLIFITRTNGRFWISISPMHLCSTIIAVDIVATCFCLFGSLAGGVNTNVAAVTAIWIISFGTFCLAAGLYCLLHHIQGTGDLMYEEIRQETEAEVGGDNR
ncbi:MAG: plasma membrane H+-ATPase [Bathelium mastoideum]|nr:MAG: plasma membrane H+-ATPase [Bathelium mastoideum]